MLVVGSEALACLVGSVLFRTYAIIFGLDEERIARADGQRLCSALVRLGGTFTKLGQTLGTRYDLFPEAFLAPLATLQDRVPPVDPAEIQRILLRAYGQAYIDRNFRDIDPIPLATASVAQVHKGQLSNGRRIVLKIMKPGARERFRSDAAIIKSTGSLVEAIGLLRGLPIKEVLSAICELLAMQVDFDQEIDAQQAFCRLYRQRPRLRIPEILIEHCRREIIVMEYIPIKGGLHTD
jgi:predicted unusual protein kinase regulating ubiquinone biosynthesis (AarF/ABC1/UbiB family)